jgi:hypothetical protein
MSVPVQVEAAPGGLGTKKNKTENPSSPYPRALY